MSGFFEWLGSIFGYPLQLFYNVFFENFAIAIIVFTIFTRLLMFPMTISQQKSSAKMARINPKLRELQQRYKNDKERYNQEMMALYERENYSPSSGCLPLLIQLPLFLGLYQAISRPLTCTFHLSVVDKLMAVMDKIPSAALGSYASTGNTGYPEIMLVDKLKNIDINSLISYSRIFDNPFTADEIGQIQQVYDFSNGFNFLGLDLLKIPSFDPINVNVIFVFAVFIISAASMLITNKINGMQTQQGGCNGNAMAIGMGAFSAVISLSVPSAMAFYWSISSAVAPLQSYIVQKFYNANIINAKSEAQRLARLRIDEAEIIEAIEKRKGRIALRPIAAEKSLPAAGGSEQKQKQQKQQPKGKKNNNGGASYQGKKK